MIHRMKVTALIPDPLVKEVSRHTKGKNLTECLVIALKEWVASKRISDLNREIASRPLKFRRSFSAARIRALNRQA